MPLRVTTQPRATARGASELSFHAAALTALWDEAVCSAPDSSDKLRKFISSRLKDPSDREAVRKVAQALFRRGYSWDDIRTALKEFETDTEVY